MSTSETIAKLESLLVRIRSRADEPRRRAAVAAVAPVAVAVAPAPAPVELPPAHAPEPSPLDDEVTLALPTRPPPAATETDIVVDVDVQDATAETVIGVPADEVVPAEAFESRERLVAAEPVAELAPEQAAELPEQAVELAPEPVAEIAAAPSATEPPAEIIEEVPAELLAAEEDVEEAPLSSRRPVAPQPEERLAEMAFGAEEPRPPRHTPPPESGRLPAAPAEPPEFDGDVTGVREAASVPHAAMPHAGEELERPRPRPAPALVPETTVAALVETDAVADVVGEAQRFAPSTFAALLDASLAL